MSTGNYETTGSILWPYDDDEPLILICNACFNRLDDCEAVDPCVIMVRGLERIFCDSCASDLTRLRMEGEVPPVSDKTKRLI